MLEDRPDVHPVVSGVFGHADWERFKSDVTTLVSVLRRREQRRWALCLRDSYNFAVAFMAAAHAGCELILPGNLQPEALSEISNSFDGILQDTEMPALKDTERIHLPLTSANDGVRSPFTRLDLDTVFIKLYTSGSSGTPKPVRKMLAVLNAEIQTLEKIWGEKIENSLIAGTVSHQHIYGLLFRILWPLCAGRPFERRMREHPEQVMNHGGDVTLISSPALLKRLDANGETANYRAVFSSGGVLPFWAVKRCSELLKTTPIEVFGSTETGGIAFRTATTADTAWELFPPIEMKLNPAGCLCLRSPFLDMDDWVETSDRCRLLSDRTFMLAGRGRPNC